MAASSIAKSSLLGEGFDGVERQRPGLAPAGDSLLAKTAAPVFLLVQGALRECLRPSKGSKRSTPRCPCPFGFAYGQPAVLAHRAGPRNSLRAIALRSDRRGQYVDEAGVSCGTPAALRAELLGTGRGAKAGGVPALCVESGFLSVFGRRFLLHKNMPLSITKLSRPRSQPFLPAPRSAAPGVAVAPQDAAAS